MKKNILKCFFVLCLVMIKTVSYSQTVQFNYDQTGNRISRLIVEKELKSILTDSLVLRNEQNKLTQCVGASKVYVFPNPTSDILTIKCEEMDKICSAELFLFSDNGELLKKEELNEAARNVDLSMYPNGTYFLKLRLKDRIESWKIIKKS